MLRSLGYSRIAAIVEVHTRLGGHNPTPDEPLHEAEVVYMADKSYRRTTRVSIEERYGIWRNTWKDNPERLGASPGARTGPRPCGPGLRRRWGNS